MKRIFIVFLGLTLVFTSLIIIAFFATPERSAPAPVATTLFPLYDITRSITGDTLEVALIVPPGTSTHTFDPTPSTLRSLQETQVVYAFGHGSDDWVDPIIASVGAEKVVVDAGISLRDTSAVLEDDHADDDHHDDDDHDSEMHEEEEDDHGHAHGPIDPHYWLNILNAQQIARTITVDLSARFPEHADVFSANLDAYLAELSAADAEVRAILSPVSNSAFIATHDAWYYFAEAYGLRFVGTFEPTAGREVTPQHLQQLSALVLEEELQVIYSEPQLSTSSIESFARDFNLRVAVLDPIGGGASSSSYINLLLSNARTIAENN